MSAWRFYGRAWKPLGQNTQRQSGKIFLDIDNIEGERPKLRSG